MRQRLESELYGGIWGRVVEAFTGNNPDVTVVLSRFDAPKTAEQIANEALQAQGMAPLHGQWDHVMVETQFGNRTLTPEEFAEKLASGDTDWRIMGAASR